MKHTPGPWHFVPENAGLMLDHGYGILYGEADYWGWEKNLYVSVGCSGNVRRELGEGVAEANARLIASAPDLLAACQRAAQFITNGVELGYIRMPDPGTPDSAHGTLPAILAALARATGAQP